MTGYDVIFVVVSLLYFAFAYQCKPPFPTHFYKLFEVEEGDDRALYKETQNLLFRGFLIFLVVLLGAYAIVSRIFGGN